ncbi:S8 family peptidase [Sungkyunkwania multivorans]|uniref:S8 family peptidase n=1 Tax=Sungkyunkwania multivorans TaxID=1173618 RepID=A0ABW3CZG0_9FLAO
MKKVSKRIALLALTTLVLASCGAPTLISTPIENIDAIPLKTIPLSEEERKSWGHADLVSDTIPGMSVDKAYEEFIKGKKGTTVIVGVIDSGVDIEHEDLKNVVWVNKDERPGNGKDDDNNGYVDDIHGWNFLGDSNDEQLEMTRIVAKGDDGSEIYKKAKAKLEKELADLQGPKNQLDFILNVDKTLQNHLKKETYTKEEVEAIDTEDKEVVQAKQIMLQILNGQEMSKADFDKEIKNFQDYVYDQLNYNLNVNFDGRKVVGDDPYNFNDKNYGNPNVIGPNKEDAGHGTHVAGIIAAQRNNNKGIDGVANNVEIMAIRAVPNGDEYDKDIALAIRYAVDNGAKIINTSFGKAFSPNAEWVRDAIKYAGEKDVLIVNAAGNDGIDLDDTENDVFPNDAIDNGPEVSDTFISVGALANKYGAELVAGFSNYGKQNVDVFAPGSGIYSTTPKDNYEFKGGTSMAAPAVAGVAALIRSLYPKLTASQVKQILIDSGLAVKTKVIVGGKVDDVRSFSELSKSGKMVNAYNALIMAQKMSK